MATLVDIGISVRERGGNPWLARLLESLSAVPAGIDAEVLVEEGAVLCRAEKRMRLLRRSRAPFLCLMEDDTVAIQPGWLWRLATSMVRHQDLVGAVCPLETRTQEPPPLADQLVQTPVAPGFCVLVNRAADPAWDPRAQVLDDLYLTLRLRRAGWAILTDMGAVVRHTREPWLSDTAMPWQQGSKARWAYDPSMPYTEDMHELRFRRAARFLWQEFGELAEIALPPERLQKLRALGDIL